MPSPSLISTQSITKSYGARPLFSDISLHVAEGDRVGLIGPNGAGKSTLLKILAGLETVDSGEISCKRSMRMIYLPQEDVLDPEKTVEETLFGDASEPLEPWQLHKRRQEILRVIEWDDTGVKVETLSGGWRKKVAIGRALFQRPDLLLLDEPTNHLDLEGILWLEALLQNPFFAFVLVSHDRFFLENTANRIVELNRRYPEGFFKAEGTYSAFVEKKEKFLQEQQKQEAALSNKVRREIEWLRRGAKARTTKAAYRVDKAHRLQEDFEAAKDRGRRDRSVHIAFDATGRKTKRLLVAKNLAKSLGGRLLFENLDLKLSPGTVVGVMGRNGTGKSTLIQILSGRIAPDAGAVKTAEGVKIAMLDQQRRLSGQTQSLRRALAPEGDTVVYGERPFHVAAWANRFLFDTDQLGMPVSELSGGEKARLLIADLMRQPADILLLDEPTNDLDIPTLQVLEESLEQFPGAVVLITHDRFLMARLCGFLLWIDGEGGAQFFADYRQWRRYVQELESTPTLPGSPEKPPPDQKPGKRVREARKALDRIERQIEKAEAAAGDLQRKLYDPAVTSDADRLAQLYAEHQEARAKVEQLYQRWAQLAEDEASDSAGGGPPSGI